MPSLPAVIERALSAYDLRTRRLHLLRGVAEAILLLVTGTFTLSVLDLLLRPSSTALGMGTLFLYAGVGVCFFWRTIRVLLRPADPVRLARAVESHIPDGMEETLSSAVGFTLSPPKGVSPWMARRTVALAAKRIHRLDTAALIDPKPVRRVMRRSAALLGLVVVLGLVPPIREHLLRTVVPFSGRARLARTELDVVPGDVHLVVGEPLRIEARSKPLSHQAEIVIHWEDGLHETLRMVTEDAGSHVFSLPAVSQGFRYSVRAGDAESRRHTVVLGTVPTLASMQLEVEPPAYAGLSPLTIPGGDATVLRGTRITLDVRTEAPEAKTVWMVPVGEEPIPLAIENGHATHSWDAESGMRYALRVRGSDGHEVTWPTTWRIDVRPDAPPALTLTSEGTGHGLVGREEILPLRIRAEDGVGLDALSLVVESPDTGNRWRRTLVIPPEERLLFARDLPLSLSRYPLAEGQRIAIHLEGRDKAGQVAHSAPIRLLVGEGNQASEERLLAALRADLEGIRRERGLLQAEGVRLHENLLLGDLDDEADPAVRQAVRASLRRLLRSAESIRELGTRMVASDANVGAAGRTRAMLGRALVEWSRMAEGFWQLEMEAIQAGTWTPRRVEAIHPLALSVRTDLAALERPVLLLGAGLDASLLAQRTRLIRGRVTRGSALLEGHFAWQSKQRQWMPKLHAHIFEGEEMKGRAIARFPALPVHDGQAAPNLPRTNWSARYTGELHVSEDGRFEFHVRVDDGVRILMRGEDVFGGRAWRTQAPTDYSATVNLTAGWHPVVVEYFQGGGGAMLDLRFGSAGRDPVPLDASNTRHPPSGDGGVHLAQAGASLREWMSEASPETVRQAREILASCQVSLRDVPNTLARLSDETGLQELERLLRRLPSGDTPESEESASRTVLAAAWDHERVLAFRHHAGVMDDGAGEARRILERALTDVLPKRENLHADARIPSLMDTLRRTQERRQEAHLDRNPGDARRPHPDAMRELLARMDADLARLEVAARDPRELAERIHAPETHRHARPHLAEARNHLRHEVADQVQAAREHLHHLADEDLDSGERRDRARDLERALREVESSLNHAQRAEARALQVEDGARADAVLAKLDEARREPAADPGAVEEALREVAERRPPADARRERIEQALARAEAEGKPLQVEDVDDDLRRDLVTMAREGERERTRNLSSDVFRDMERALQEHREGRLQENPQARDELAEWMGEKAEVAVLEVRASADPVRTRAAEALREEVMEAIRKDEPLTREEERELRARVESIRRNRQDDPVMVEAREALEAAGMTEADTLAALAREAEEAVRRRDRREPLVDALRELAPDKEAVADAVAVRPEETTPREVKAIRDHLQERLEEKADAERELREAMQELRNVLAQTPDAEAAVMDGETLAASIDKDVAEGQRETIRAALDRHDAKVLAMAEALAKLDAVSSPEVADVVDEERIPAKVDDDAAATTEAGDVDAEAVVADVADADPVVAQAGDVDPSAPATPSTPTDAAHGDDGAPAAGEAVTADARDADAAPTPGDAPGAPTAPSDPSAPTEVAQAGDVDPSAPAAPSTPTDAAHGDDGAPAAGEAVTADARDADAAPTPGDASGAPSDPSAPTEVAQVGDVDPSAPATPSTPTDAAHADEAAPSLPTDTAHADAAAADSQPIPSAPEHAPRVDAQTLQAASDLAQTAKEAAEELRKDAVAPLADAVQALAHDKDSEEAATRLSEIGQALAEKAAREEQAARRLEAALARVHAVQEELAEATRDAAAVTSTPMPAHPEGTPVAHADTAAPSPAHAPGEAAPSAPGESTPGGAAHAPGEAAPSAPSESTPGEAAHAPGEAAPSAPSESTPGEAAPSASDAFAQAVQAAQQAIQSSPDDTGFARAAEALAQASDAMQTAQAQAQAQSQAQAQAPSSAQGEGEGEDGQGGEGGGEGTTPDLAHAPDDTVGDDQAEWLQLPDRVRRSIRDGSGGEFSEEHQATIRAYFRRLGEEQ